MHGAVGGNSKNDMGQIFYNHLKNSRIKNIALGLILYMVIFLLLYIFSLKSTDGKPTNTFIGLLFYLVIGGLVILIGLIPFGQVIESKQKEFETYYRLGQLKFKRQKWGQVDSVSLEQNEDRFYCLTVRTVSGKNFIIERYPTLDKATVRLDEFKRLFE